jgi:hypothetical protein
MSDLLLHWFIVDEAVVEHAGDDDEEGKEEELREEAGDDEFLARVEGCEGATSLNAATYKDRQLVVSRYTGVKLTGALQHEAEHISSHEHFRKPLLSNQRVAFAIDQLDDATEDDVYRCGKERGCD